MRSGFAADLLIAMCVIACGVWCTFFLGSSFAEGDFDSELSSLRKSIINSCAQLQAGQPRESQEQLLAEIDAIITVWQAIADKYKNAPPSEYAKDPDWKNYFDEALDNLRIMRQKAEQKDYKRAAQFCGSNCALFVKIHQINGTTSVTDKMFTLRQNLRLALSMANASNWDGAQKILDASSRDFEEIKKFPPPHGAAKEEYVNDMNLVEQAFEELKSAFDAKDLSTLSKQFKAFLEVFNKFYLKYV